MFQPTRARQYAAYLLVRLSVCVLQALRVDTCERLSQTMATLLHRVLKVRRRIVDVNLRAAFPELTEPERQQLARRMWESLLLMVCEVALAPRKLRLYTIGKHVRYVNPRPYVEALLSDRPVMAVSAHYGNFEVGGYMMGMLGFPSYTVARPLDNPYLNDFLNRFRGAFGQYIIPKRGGYDTIARVLESGGHMSLLADQYAGSRGCWVEFFGRPASAHKAIALIALEHDTVVVCCCFRRRGGRFLQFDSIVTDVVDPRCSTGGRGGVRELTQWYTQEVEEFVRAAPDQYWWLHDRWKDNREAHKRARAAAKAA